VVCGDEDDLASLWALRHTVEGSVRQESVLLLPSEKPVAWGSPSMIFSELRGLSGAALWGVSVRIRVLCLAHRKPIVLLLARWVW
jgi:hypothetical protein